MAKYSPRHYMEVETILLMQKMGHIVRYADVDGKSSNMKCPRCGYYQVVTPNMDEEDVEPCLVEK